LRDLKSVQQSDYYGVQQAVWQYGGATNIFSTFCSLISFSSSQRITPSNRINNELLVINLAAVWVLFDVIVVEVYGILVFAALHNAFGKFGALVF